MATKPPPTDLPTHSFSCLDDLEAYLDREHTTAPGFYLKLAKKNSGIASVTPAEAVEAALCFGWIDGRANSVDESWWTVRYTPRRSKSIWSKKNVQTIARLSEEGRLRPAGQAVVDAAKEDGRWERAYAGPATIEVPEDLKTALSEHAAAKAFFEGLNRSDRYSVLWRIETASPAARAGRISVMLEMLAVGNVPGAESKQASKSKQKQRNQTQKEKSKSSSGIHKHASTKNRTESSISSIPARRSSRTRS
jgi:uncharacterized protein YdeI (YjbR/CyaY-like superfamily)